MAIRTLVTRGFGNGTFNGTIALLVVRGYSLGTAEPEPEPGPAKPEILGGSRGITRLIMDKDELLANRIRKEDEDMIAMIVFALEMGVLE